MASTKNLRSSAQTLPATRPPKHSLLFSPMPVLPLLNDPKSFMWLNLILLEMNRKIELVSLARMSQCQSTLHQTMKQTAPSANARPGMLTPMKHSLARLSLLARPCLLVIGSLDILSVRALRADILKD